MSQSRVSHRRSSLVTLFAAILFALASTPLLMGMTDLDPDIYGSKGTPYPIKTGEDLVSFTRGDYKGLTYARLEADIEITDATLKYGQLVLKENEILLGDNHGITLNLSKHDGLFSSVKGIIQDVHIHGSVTSSNSVVGSLVETLYTPGTLINCINYADVKGAYVVGGLIGRIDEKGYERYTPGYGSYGYTEEDTSTALTYCGNYGTVTATSSKDKESQVGGLVGEITAEKNERQPAYVGIEYSFNAGTISGPGKNVAGIAGEVVVDEHSRSYFYYCYNTGTIDGGSQDAAGIIAHADNEVDIAHCYNAGIVTADKTKTAHGILHWDQTSKNAQLEHNYSVDLGNLGWKSGTQNGTVVSADNLKKNEDILADLGTNHYIQATDDDMNKGYPLIKEHNEALSFTLTYNFPDNVDDQVPSSVHQDQQVFTKVLYGRTMPAPNPGPKELEGRVFEYWTTEAPDSRGRYDHAPEPYPFSGIYRDTVLYSYYSLNLVTLKFDPAPPSDMNIEYDWNGPEEMEMVVQYGRPAPDLPEPVSKTSGYTFKNWIAVTSTRAIIKPEPVLPVITYPGPVQEMKANWVKGEAYVTKQPADVVAKLGDRPEFSVEAKIDDEYTIGYQWYRGYNPDDPASFFPIEKDKGGQDATYKPYPNNDYDPGVQYSDGNTYYFCEIGYLYSSGKGEQMEPLIRTRTARLSLDPEPQITASVDKANIEIDLSTAKKMQNGRYTYEYKIPVKISLLNYDKLIKQAHRLNFAISIPDHNGQPHISSHENISYTLDHQKEFTYYEKVRLYPNYQRVATITGSTISTNSFESSEVKGEHISADLNEVSSTFIAPEDAVVPESVEPTVLWDTKGKPYDDGGYGIWNPYGSKNDEKIIQLSDTPLAIVDMNWGSGFTPKDNNVFITWEYSLDGINWTAIDNVRTDMASKQENNVWKTRAVGAIKPELAMNDTRFRAIVSTRESSSVLTKTSDPSSLLRIDIPSPTSITATAGGSNWGTVSWSWDASTQGIPTDGTSDNYGFLITYSYTAGPEHATWTETNTTKVHYSEAEGTTQTAKLLGLQTGTTYKVSVQAYANQGLSSDPNREYAEFETTGLSPGEYDIDPHEVALAVGDFWSFTAEYEPLFKDQVPWKYVWQVSYDGETGWENVEYDPNYMSGNLYNHTLTEDGPTYVRCIIFVLNADTVTTPVGHVSKQLSVPPNPEAKPQTYSATLKWDTQDGAQDYLIRYVNAQQKLPDDDPSWQYLQVENTTETTIANLNPNSTYRWQVRALTSTGGVASEWTSCTWHDDKSKGTFTTKKVAKVGTWITTLEDNNPQDTSIKLIAENTSNISSDDRKGITFTWQYRDAGAHEWVNLGEPSEKDSLTHGLNTAGNNDYGRSWRCVVTKATSTDSIDTYTTNEVTPTILPPYVTNFNLMPETTAINLSWNLLANVDLYEITYGTAGSGAEEINDAITISVSAEGGESSRNYTTENGRASYTLTDLKPETDYRVKIVGNKLGQVSKTATFANTKTLPQPSLPVISTQPKTQFASIGEHTEVTFSVLTTKPEEGKGELSARLERFQPGENNTPGTWVTFDKTPASAVDTNNGLLRFTSTIKPTDGTWRYMDASKVRFVITNTSGNTTASATSNEVYLMILAKQPTLSVVENSATTSSIEVTLDSTLDGVPTTNRFTVYWSDDSNASDKNVANWNHATVEADEAGKATYTINGLNPGKEYQIAARCTPVVNGITLPPSKLPDIVTEFTLAENPLESVTINPQQTVEAVDTRVTLTATPTFAENANHPAVTYQWQKFSTGSEENTWNNIESATASTYDTTINDSTEGVYRCIATAGGESNTTPRIAEKSVTSNRALIWKAATPTPPSALIVGAVDASTAELFWTGEDGFTGTYLIEYRKSGERDWQQTFEATTSHLLKNLTPNTTYEWHVTAEGENGTSSQSESDSSFTTLSGSALTKVWATPSLMQLEMPQNYTGSTVTLTAGTDVDGTEEMLTYQWYMSDDGVSWNIVEGATAQQQVLPAPYFPKEGVPYFGTRQYRCVVTATHHGDEKTVTGTPASVSLIPPAPIVTAVPTNVTTTAATVAWSAANANGTVEYEVEYRKQGTGDWTTLQPTGSTSATISNLEKDTAYEWHVRSLGKTESNSAGNENYSSTQSENAAFVTLADSGLSKAVITPALLRYDVAAGGDAKLHVMTNAQPGTKLTYQWQWHTAKETDQGWHPIEDGDHFTGSSTDSLTVKQAFAQSADANGAHFQCVVKTGSGSAQAEATSTQAVLLYRLEAPSALNANNASFNSITLSWKDKVPYAGTYTLQYRPVEQKVALASFAQFAMDPLGLLDAARSGEQGAVQTTLSSDGWTTISGIPRGDSGITTYQLRNLTPHTSYEWNVKYVLSAGGIEGPAANGPTFSTLTGSALSSAEVSPKTIACNQNESATFKVTTNVDGVERLNYQWYFAERDASEWTKLEGETHQKLTVTTGEKDLGTRFRCEVTSFNNGDTTSITSTEATLWKRLVVAPPKDLTVSANAATAFLNWESDAAVDGFFTVEYREQGGQWQTVKGIKGTSYDLRGLKPTTTYEWRVAHVLADNLTSSFANGEPFTTIEGCQLTRVTVEPWSLRVTPYSKPVLTATTNVLPADETVTYQWQLVYEPGGEGNDHWDNAPEGKSNIYKVPGLDQYDITPYRCVVTSMRNGDTKKVTSPEVMVYVVPRVPGNLAASNVSTNEAKLSWEKVGTEMLHTTYEVAWRDQKSNEWNTTSVNDASYNLTGLLPSTTYEWRVRAKAEDDSTLASDWSDTSSFVTLGQSGLSMASVTPVIYRYDTVKKGDALFQVHTDADALSGESNSLSYQWQWKLANDTEWHNVVSGDNFTATKGTLTVREAFAIREDAYGSAFRCIVSTNLGTEPIESSAALLVHRIPEPVKLVANASMNSVMLSWTDTIKREGTYTLQYRKDSASSIEELSEDAINLAAATPTADGEWMTVEGILRDASGTTSYQLNNLDPGSSYKWRIRFVTALGVKGGWVDGEPFQTLAAPEPDPGPDDPEVVAAPPFELNADVMDAKTAHLTWSCDQSEGSFTVEYRAKASSALAQAATSSTGFASLNEQAATDWQKVTVSEREALLENLQPNTTYEWRVTHVLPDGTASAAIDGPAFTTLAEEPEPGPGPEPGPEPGPTPDPDNPTPGTDPKPLPGPDADNGTNGTSEKTLLSGTGDSVPAGVPGVLVVLATAAAATLVLALTKRQHATAYPKRRASSKPARHQK